MNKPHQIDLNDFVGYYKKSDLASSIGKGSCKTLYAVISVGLYEPVIYEVESHGKTICSTTSFGEAVAAYNEEP